MAGGLKKPEQLRKKAAEERRKIQEIDRLLARLESRLDSADLDAEGKTGRQIRPDDRRSFIRKAADLVIRYRWPDRHTPLIGRVRDISRGGMRFCASRELAPGLLLQASLHTPSGAGPRVGGQMYLEVVHCRKNNDLWDIATRFTPMPVDKFRGSERRTSTRHDVDLDITFRVSGREKNEVMKGKVRDLSRGGVRFNSPERLRQGSMAAAVVSGRSARKPAEAATRIKVSAIIKIVRCRKMGGHYEIGAQFVG